MNVHRETCQAMFSVVPFRYHLPKSQIHPSILFVFRTLRLGELGACSACAFQQKVSNVCYNFSFFRDVKQFCFILLGVNYLLENMFWLGFSQNKDLHMKNFFHKRKHNRIKYKLSDWIWTRQTKSRKRAAREDTESETTHSHAQKSHKNIKLKAVLYMQRTWYRSVQVLCLLIQYLWVLHYF